jgi:uncharacterized protein YgiM (DUF1202 family)
MAEGRRNLNRLELIVIALLLLIFFVWAISKCSARKSELNQDAESNLTQATVDSVLVDSTAVADTSQTAPAPAATTVPAPNQPVVTTPEAANAAAAGTTPAITGGTLAATPATPAEPALSRLYVTIDKLKLRKGPGLDSVVVAQLPLFEEVYFLNEVTEYKTELSLGYEKANEPWVKVRTKKGKEGWVYGAGINYYKEKRKGVLE